MADQFISATGSANPAGRVPAQVLQTRPIESDRPPSFRLQPADTGFLANVPAAGAGALASGHADPCFIDTLKGFGVIGEKENVLDWKDWLICQGVGRRTIEALARDRRVGQGAPGHDRE